MIVGQWRDQLHNFLPYFRNAAALNQPAIIEQATRSTIQVLHILRYDHRRNQINQGLLDDMEVLIRFNRAAYPS